MIIQRKDALNSIIFGLLLFFTAIYCFTPIIKSSAILLFLEGCFTAFVLSHLGDSCYRVNSRIVFFVFLYFFICILYKFFGVSSVAPGALVIHLFFFVSILLMLLLPKLIYTKQHHELIWAIVIIMLINIIDNIYLCIKYPEVALAVNRDFEFEKLNINIGASGFYSAVCFFFIISFFGYLNCREKKIRYLLLCGVTVSAVFIFGFCLKASVLVYTFFSAFFLFFARKAKNLHWFILRVAIPTLIVYMFISYYSEIIIDLIYKTFPSERLAQRLIYLIDPNNAEVRGAEVTVEARENLWKLSLNTWTANLANFVFGVGDHRVNQYLGQSVSQIGIGLHSDFFDSLARYGLIGLVLLFQIFILSFRYLLELFDKEYRVQLFVIFLIFVLFGFTKGVFRPDIGLVLFIFLPMMAKVINNEQK